MKNFNVDTWWKALLLLGIFATVGAATFKIEFIERKHLFGVGLGMIMIGIGLWKSYKTFSQSEQGGIISWKDFKYDFVSIVLIAIGTILLLLFGFLIVKGLI